MNTPSLGEARFRSGAGHHSISDDVRIPEHIEVGADAGLQFELAGPRARLFFDGKNTRVRLEQPDATITRNIAIFTFHPLTNAPRATVRIVAETLPDARTLLVPTAITRLPAARAALTRRAVSKGTR